MLKSLLKRFPKKYYNEFIANYMKVAKAIYKLRFDDTFYEFDSYALKQVIDSFVLMNAHHIKNWIDRILELQKEPDKAYGDIDWSFEII
jgi:hypothetical protein